MRSDAAPPSQPLFEPAGGDMLLAAWLARHAPAVPDVRAALDGSASPDGLIAGLSEAFVQRARDSLAILRSQPAAAAGALLAEVLDGIAEGLERADVRRERARLASWRVLS
jgi:hypothetical protein